MTHISETAKKFWLNRLGIRIYEDKTEFDGCEIVEGNYGCIWVYPKERNQESLSPCDFCYVKDPIRCSFCSKAYIYPFRNP